MKGEKGSYIFCEICGNSFYAHAYRLKKGKVRFCSTKCFSSRPILEETRLKMSFAKQGIIPWNKGVEMWKNREHPRGTLGMVGLNKGRKISETTRQKLIVSHRGKKYPAFTGEKHWNWRGGVTDVNEAVRKSAEYKAWRRKVFERDEYTCQECNQRGGELHAEHIKPFAIYKELRFEVSNGKTLCVSCHRKTDTYGGRMVKIKSELSTANTCNNEGKGVLSTHERSSN